jgi:glutathione synthase
MNKKILYVTDILETLNLKKDTSVLMMEESLNLGFDVYQCEMDDLYIENTLVKVSPKKITAADTTKIKSNLCSEINLSEFKYCFMRKDPPVDENYINTLHFLGLAESQGTIVYNNPLAIKEFNEKIFALHFAQHIPETLITNKIKKIDLFLSNKQSVVIKPLDGMGGQSIYKIEKLEAEEIKILEDMTSNERTHIIVQEFIEEIYQGDIRVLIINGIPFPKTLARIPQGNSFKGNLAAGGKGVVMDISDFQHKLGTEIGNYLMQKGINFAGIDIIGKYLTEINVTSPTCARQILEQSGMNPIDEYFKGL